MGVQRHNVPQIKGLIKPDWNQKRPRAWQHYFPLPRPLEKSRFIREKCDRTKTFVFGCKHEKINIGIFGLKTGL